MSLSFGIVRPQFFRLTENLQIVFEINASYDGRGRLFRLGG